MPDNTSQQSRGVNISTANMQVGGDIIGRDKITHGYAAEQVQTLIADISKNFQSKPFDGRCPYIGLSSFDESNVQWFFGRETLISELVERLKSSQAIFVAGASGSGKSSLVKAGLIHALKTEALPHSDNWLYEVIKPGRAPLEALARAAASFTKTTNARDEILNKGAADSSMLSQWADIALGEGDPTRRAVIVIDQFEEIFTQLPPEREAERVAFLNLLTYALTIEGGRVIVIFTMRSDFVSACAKYPKLNALLNQQFLQVGIMSSEELVKAIALPALQVGLKVDPDLISQIIADMNNEPGTLPLMQFTLRSLFDTQQQAGGIIALTRANYLKGGGLQKSLERHADAEFAKLDKKEQELARNVFRGLIQIDTRRTALSRRTALYSELVPKGVAPSTVNAVVQKLASARLITTNEQDGETEGTVTISHEKLLDAWPWLKTLVDQNREAIMLETKIKDNAAEWEQNKRDASFLFGGARLEAVCGQVAFKNLVLSASAQAFVNASITNADREKQQKRELEIIATFSAELRSAEARSEMYPIILDQLIRLMNLDGASIVITRPNKDLVVELGRGIWEKASGVILEYGEGVTGQVMISGKPYFTHDTQLDPLFAHPEFYKNVKSAACVPLIAQSETIGVMWIARDSVISEDEVQLLIAISEMAAIALQRATLHEQTAKQLDRIVALHTIELGIANRSDLNVTLNILLTQTLSQLQVNAAAVLICRAQIQMLEYVAGNGFHTRGIEQTRLRLGEGHAGRAALERRIIYIPDLTTEPLVREKELAPEKFVSYCAAPLIAIGNVKGVLEVFTRTRLTADDDWMSFFEVLAAQAAIAIENATPQSG